MQRADRTITLDAPLEAFKSQVYAEKLDAGGVLHEVLEAEPFDIPDDADHFTLVAQRHDFSKADGKLAIKCRAEISLDGGKTWQLLVAFTALGGDVLDPQGDIATESSVAIRLPKGQGRLARTQLIPLKEISTAVEVTCRNLSLSDNPAKLPQSVAFDSVNSVAANGVSSASYTHTPSGTPTGVGFSAAWYNDASTLTLTYGGNAVVEEVSATENSSTNCLVKIYSLANPPSGAQIVNAAFSGTAYGGIGSIAVVGGDTSDVFDNTATVSNQSGTTTSLGCSGAADGLFMDCMFQRSSFSGPATATGTGQTARFNASAPSDRTHGSTIPGAASATFAWDMGNSSGWGAVAASFKAAGGGTQTLTVVAAGGIVLGGVSTQSRARAVAPAGGVVFAGAAALNRITSRLAAGGIVFAGSAPETSSGIQHLTVVPSGGIVLGGVAPAIRKTAWAAAGGLALAGAAALTRITSRLAAGGVSFGGAAATAFHQSTRAVIAAGGILFSGHATTSFVGGLRHAVNYLWFARRRGRR